MLDLEKSKRYLLACSFGPDSMALFNMLLKEGFIFDVAHVNYHFRKESNNEEISLRRICEKNHINVYVFNNEKIVHSNVESFARDIRYDFFASLYKSNNYYGLLIAHNLDDSLETYILQKKRKIIPICFGLQLFSTFQNMKIYRPLLEFTKAELLNYCKTNYVPYCIDQSNFSNDYERNKIRHEIIEKMTDLEKTNMLNDILIENELLDIQRGAILKGKIHDVTYLKQLDIKSLQIALNMVSYNKREYVPISHKVTLSFMKSLNSNKANYMVPISKDYFFLVQYGEVRLSSYKSVSYIYKYDAPGMYTNRFYDVNLNLLTKGSYPLVIRPAISSDVYTIKDYQCKVRRLYIDWKMPQSIRKLWPVIVDSNGDIVYIPRYKKDFKSEKQSIFIIKKSILLS